MGIALLSPSFYGTLFLAVWRFLVKPGYADNSVLGIGEKLRDTLGLFVIKLFLFVLIAVFMALISPLFDPKNLTVDSITTRFSPIMLFLVAALALPLLEELGFRLSLRFKPIFLATSLAVICYYFLTKLVYQTSNSMIDESFAVRAGLSIAMGVVFFLIFQVDHVARRLARFWQRHFRWIFYLSCASFAFVHLFNYELTPVNLIL
ncbi:MAG: hypothetical protein AAF385_06855, partial [Pseudomonadota bacterium]